MSEYEVTATVFCTESESFDVTVGPYPRDGCVRSIQTVIYERLYNRNDLPMNIHFAWKEVHECGRTCDPVCNKSRE